VIARACSWKTAAGATARTASYAASLARVTSSGCPRPTIRSAIDAICAGVLPIPRITSGNPCRSSRCVSTRAKPRSSSGAKAERSEDVLRGSGDVDVAGAQA
jgi:hypothetical protein